MRWKSSLYVSSMFSVCVHRARVKGTGRGGDCRGEPGAHPGTGPAARAGPAPPALLGPAPGSSAGVRGDHPCRSCSPLRLGWNSPGAGITQSAAGALGEHGTAEGPWAAGPLPGRGTGRGQGGRLSRESHTPAFGL